MGRPPLPLGTYGKVLFLALPGGQVKVRVKFRDYDGRVRLVSKVGQSRASAERALKAELTGRQAPGWRRCDHLRDANGHLGRCLDRSRPRLVDRHTSVSLVDGCDAACLPRTSMTILARACCSVGWRMASAASASS